MSGKKADLKYPIDLDGVPLSNYVMFTSFNRKTRKNSEIDKIIALYMPENLMNTSTVSWDSQELGSIGNLMMQSIVNSGSVDAGLQSLSDNILPAATSHYGAKGFGALARKVGSNLDGAGAVGAVFQKIPNPFLTMVFRGVNFRTFEFTFKLYPHSKKEAEEIHKIIKEFRAAAYPSKPEGSDQPYFLEYPKEFEIEYHFIDDMMSDKLNEYLNKFKRCVLTAVDVNYTGQGMFSVHRDGFPSIISLVLRFTEIEILLRHDIEDGGF